MVMSVAAEQRCGRDRRALMNDKYVYVLDVSAARLRFLEQWDWIYFRIGIWAD